MKRRQWFDLHSWVGLQLSILMSFVLVTGTFATISPDLDWLFNDAMQARHGQPIEIDWGAALDSATRAYPEATILSIRAPQAPRFNIEIIAQDPDSRMFRIYIDPVTHAVTGTGRWYNWQRFFRMTHRHLMLPTKIGVIIVGLLSIPLFISFFSSFYIYKRWWRGFLRFPRQVAATAPSHEIRRARSYWGALHRLSGVWSLWFILLMAITGSWYLIEELGGRAQYPALPTVEASPAANLDGSQLNELTAAARKHYPALIVDRISLQRQAQNTVLFQGQAKAILVRNRANQLAFNLNTGELLDLRKGENLSLHVRISEAADPLHFGTFGGDLTRYLWFLFGTLLSGLSLSGVYLYGLRLHTQRKAPARTAWKVSWQDTVRPFRWLMLLILVSTLVLSALVFTVDPALLA